LDSGPDAGADGGFDAATDVGLDSGFDTGADAEISDSGADGGFDAGYDAAIDSGADSSVPSDASFDDAQDGSFDVGLDAGDAGDAGNGPVITSIDGTGPEMGVSPRPEDMATWNTHAGDRTPTQHRLLVENTEIVVTGDRLASVTLAQLEGQTGQGTYQMTINGGVQWKPHRREVPPHPRKT